MDEPLSNLDAKLRIETRAEIRRIHRELGRTTIYVTHDQDEALSLADRIVVLREGKAEQVAPPHDVYTQPANLHVARFMGYRNVIDFEATPSPQPGRVSLRREGMSLVGTARQPLPAGGRLLAPNPPADPPVGARSGSQKPPARR